MTTVRDAALDAARAQGLTTWFGNPGSTEIPLLSDFPDDIRYVLALHESAAVSMAAGYALATGQPALASLHTTAGLGNGVSAIATARVNRAPVVVLVGQQDRRHLMAEPFLTGRLEGLAGDYPLEVVTPPRAQDVPGCLVHARHVAAAGRGPVVVIVPMDDWDAEMDDTPLPSPRRVLEAAEVAAADVADIAEMLRAAAAPVIVTGAGTDDDASWSALVALADRLRCPVFHEPFTARAGFPQHHPRFAGFLPAGRADLRDALAPYDTVLVAGTSMLRQYHFEPGPLVNAGTRVAVISADAAEVRRSAAEIGLVASPAAAVRRLVASLGPGADDVRDSDRSSLGLATKRRQALAPPADRLSAEALFAGIATRRDPETVVVEESPSSRDALQLLVPTVRPLGFLSAAMGGLGFGMPAAIGVKMGAPHRPVLAVIGDGSSLYCIQSLWSAAQYGVGVVFFVMNNSHYLVMERLTSRRGKAPWPPLTGLSVSGLARSFGVETTTVDSLDTLGTVLDSVMPTLRDRREPLVVEVALGEVR